MQEWLVEPENAGLSLVAYIRRKINQTSLSSRKIKRAIESNACSVNGFLERFASRKICLGDRVQFLTQELKQPLNTQSKVEGFDPKRVIFEDVKLFIYNKPAKIDVYALEKALKKYSPSLRLVHRLDKGTSGVLLLAKSQCVYKALSLEFSQRRIKKTYLALVDGIPKEDKGKIHNCLGQRGSYEGQVLWGEVKGGKEALTFWVKIQEGKEWALLRCSPQTGRTHQIRVHMSQIGHPILGDSQYGRQQRIRGLDHHLLHAESLEFHFEGKRKFEAANDWLELEGVDKLKH